MILKKKIIKILGRKRKGESQEDRVRVVNKLRKKERLTGDEFWNVYELIRQEGPQVNFANPDNWIKYRK